MGIFSRASGNFKGGWVMSIEEVRKSWDLDTPFRVTLPAPWTPPRCIGGVGRYGFSPQRYGAMKLCLSYTCCEF